MFTDNKLLFLGVVLLLFPFFSSAYEKDFPPYLAGKFPSNCQINLLAADKESARDQGKFKSSYHLNDLNKVMMLRLDMNYSEEAFGLYASLQEVQEKIQKKALMPAVVVADHPEFIDKVYWAYLNKDKRKDLIILTHSGDMGLMNGNQQATFLLSTKEGYVSKILAGFNISGKDFYDYSTDNKCEYLHQSLLTEGMDNYWSYHVLQFIGTDIVVKNALSRYFPKWIKLMAKKNNESAVLSVKQQQTLEQDYLKHYKILSVPKKVK